MKYTLVLTALLTVTALNAAPQMDATTKPIGVEMVTPIPAQEIQAEDVLKENRNMLVSVIGQGVSPTNTVAPAQSFALAKRAAIADAYRLIAEKVKGVRVDGQDLIKNMMVKRTTVRTAVQAMVRNANIVETNFKDGLCEVEMEILISYSQFQ